MQPQDSVLVTGVGLLTPPSFGGYELTVESRRVLQRWNDSRVLPATTSRGRLRRTLVRAAVSAGIGSRSLGVADDIGVVVTSLCERTQSQRAAFCSPKPRKPPDERVYVSLFSSDGTPLLFCKFARKDKYSLIAREVALLREAPRECAPRLFAAGDAGDWCYVATEFVPWSPPPSKLEIPQALKRLLSRLRAGRLDILGREHPWVGEFISGRHLQSSAVIETLRSRSWPLCITHNDFVPGNLFTDGADRALAVDWEFSVSAGNGYVDEAYYLLSISKRKHSRSPRTALAEVLPPLQQATGLDRDSALAISAAVGAIRSADAWWEELTAAARGLLEQFVDTRSTRAVLR